GPEGKGFARRQDFPVACQLEGSARDDAGQIAIGNERWPSQTDFQGGGEGRIADERIAEGQGETVRGPPHRHAKTASAWPAVIHHPRTRPGRQQSKRATRLLDHTHVGPPPRPIGRTFLPFAPSYPQW